MARRGGGGFEEQRALEAARAVGSRSAQALLPLLMGLVHYHFGSATEASAALEQCRPFLDGLASTWHLPVFHQYAALAALALEGPARDALAPQIDASLAALRTLAGHSAPNFAHRMTLVEAEQARARGELTIALEGYARAAQEAARGCGWPPKSVEI